MRTPILAAGGIIWRTSAESNGVEVPLVHRPRYDDWTFPKGKLHAGELLIEAAVREVSEETGLSVVVGHRMPPVRYRSVDGPKEVTYWAMQPSAGMFVPNDEVDEVRWVRLARPNTMLTYDHDRRLADELTDLPPSVVRVLLVRHAHAGRRSDFTGHDNDRPLADRGMRQAQRLVGLLRLFAPTKILSAPPLRCLQTVQPLAAATGIPVEPAPMFGEDEFADNQHDAFDFLRGLSSTDEVTVISSQGGVIPALISWLCPAGGPEPVPQVAAKGGVWALAFGNGRVRADYYPPAKKLARINRA